MHFFALIAAVLAIGASTAIADIRIGQVNNPEETVSITASRDYPDKFPAILYTRISMPQRGNTFSFSSMPIL